MTYFGPTTLATFINAGVAEDANQIVYGTGPDIDSDPDFTYTSAVDGNDGQLFINTITGTGSQGSVSSTTPAKVAIYGVRFLGVANGTGGDVDIWGGYGTSTAGIATGGNVNIWGGFAVGPNAFGGDLNLLGGTGVTGAGDVNITAVSYTHLTLPTKRIV